MDREDEDNWSVELLEYWEVPDMPPDMEKRVMSKLNEQWMLGDPSPHPAQPDFPIATPRGRYVATVAIAAMVVAAAGLGLALGHYGSDVRSEPPPTVYPAVVGAPAGVATLTFEVEPYDATVEVDGTALVGPSPLIASGLAVGSHTIRVHREGFAEWTRVVDLDSGPLHLPITLRAEHAMGDVGGEFVGPIRAQSKGRAVTGRDLAEALTRGMMSADHERTPRVRMARFVSSADGESDDGETKGGLDREVIRRIVRHHLSEVRSCYTAALKRDPKLAGRVSINFTIAANGRVPLATSEPASGVGGCIAQAMRSWAFPKSDTQTVVTYPFVLSPE